MACCHLPPLRTCSSHKGSTSWPVVCSLPQPALVKVTGLPLVTAMAVICLNGRSEGVAVAPYFNEKYICWRKKN